MLAWAKRISAKFAQEVSLVHSELFSDVTSSHRPNKRKGKVLSAQLRATSPELAQLHLSNLVGTLPRLADFRFLWFLWSTNRKVPMTRREV